MAIHDVTKSKIEIVEISKLIVLKYTIFIFIGLNCYGTRQLMFIFCLIIIIFHILS